MNKRILIPVIVFSLLVACGIAYIVLQRDSVEQEVSSMAANQQQATPSSPAGTSPDSPEEPAETMPQNALTKQPGTYISYSATALANTTGDRVLFFYAPWCPQCRSIESGITDSNIPSGITLFKVDYDSNQSLRQKYGVTLQTTFVKIDENEEKISSYVAYDDPTFDSVKRNFLEK